MVDRLAVAINLLLPVLPVVFSMTGCGNPTDSSTVSVLRPVIVILARDTNWFDDEDYLTVPLALWRSNDVKEIYFIPLDESTDYGHTSYPDQRTYVFIKPADFGELCRKDGVDVNGFQENDVFEELCILDGEVTLRKKKGFSFKENPKVLSIEPELKSISL